MERQAIMCKSCFTENIGDYAVEAVCEDTDLKITAAVKDDKLIVKIVNISAEDKTSELNVDRGIKETCKTYPYRESLMTKIR